jgi:hypothetical protein
MISITGIDNIDTLIYEYLKNIEILENLEEKVRNYVSECCAEEFYNNGEDGLLRLSSRKVADDYCDTFRRQIRPWIDEYLSKINMTMSDFDYKSFFYENDFIVLDDCIYYTIIDYRYNVLSDEYGICDNCDVFLTPEYKSKKECLCCECAYSAADESSESDDESDDESDESGEFNESIEKEAEIAEIAEIEAEIAEKSDIIAEKSDIIAYLKKENAELKKQLLAQKNKELNEM